MVGIDNAMEASVAVVRIFQDKDLRDGLVEKGKERVKLFNAERTAKEHAELFRSLLGMEEN